MTYDLRGDVVVGHRLAYVPCPFQLDESLLERYPLTEVVDLYMDAAVTDVSLGTSVRFDYDPMNAGSKHPGSHLTLNRSHRRLPAVRPSVRRERP